MIQRIQTLYLLLVFILSLITLFSVQAGLVGNADAIQYVLNYKGIFNGAIYVQNVWALSALCVLIPVITLITIALYNKRILQIRLSIINSVLLAGYYGLLFIYLWQAGNVLNAESYLNIVTAFPLINIILTFLAIRAIGKDEALIKSLNRLR
ncbi:MAG: DUF4293 domain-containing protein [Paludibacter sp.]